MGNDKMCAKSVKSHKERLGAISRGRRCGDVPSNTVEHEAFGAFCSAVCSLVILASAFTHDTAIDDCLDDGQENSWPFFTDFKGFKACRVDQICSGPVSSTWNKPGIAVCGVNI